jgi:tetratricopeptide (TPR) repeat protein
MMIERHYDDESLIALIESDRIASDIHIPSCTTCGEKLESFRMIAGALRERDIWEDTLLHDTPVSSTIATLRAFADRMTDEDMQAAIWLEDLLAGSRDSWRGRLSQHPEYRTAGMVRKLIAAMYRALDTMPLDAVEVAGLATDIAEHLQPETYVSDTVTKLRGAAWREKAYALFYTGRNADARRAVQIADARCSEAVVDQYDRARVAIVAALVERSMDAGDVALVHSRSSADVFAQFGDGERYVSARSAQAAVLSQAGRYDDALSIFLELECRFAPDDSTDSHARVLSNIAFMYMHLGRPEESIKFFQVSAEIFEVLGSRSEAARVRWNVANLIASNGRWDDAASRLAFVRTEFRDLGMFGAAAVAALDLAEIRLLQSKQSDVVTLCAEASEYFNYAGLGYTARALRAIAYMREAAESGRATPQLARSVRDYVRRLPAEPALLFSPPPNDRA